MILSITALVIGPLRRYPLLVPLLCCAFAVIYGSFQNSIVSPTDSLADLIVDVSGATFAYLVYHGVLWRRARRRPIVCQTRIERL
jgi:hypothetical protein